MNLNKKMGFKLGALAIVTGLTACGGGGGGGSQITPVVNTAPVGVNIADKTVFKNEGFSFTVPEFTDADGDVLAYEAKLVGGANLPLGLTFAPSTRTFTGIGSLNLSMPLAIAVTATDPSGAKATRNFTLSGATIDTPLAELLGSKTVLGGSDFSFQIPSLSAESLVFTATLADGSPLPAGLSFDGATRTFTGLASLDLSADLSVKVTATNATNSTSGTFTLSSAAQGVFTTSTANSLFYGVVFPKVTGTAELWSWEFDNAAGYSKLLSGDVAYPGASFATVTNQRVFTSSSNTYATQIGKEVQASRITGGMSFTVGGISYNTTLDTVAWSATNAALTANDWLGNWILKEELSGVTITHIWTVDGSGNVTGSKKMGSQTLCNVQVGADSKVELTSSPVSRIKVKYDCSPSTGSTDNRIYSGISFNKTLSGASVTNKVMLMPRIDGAPVSSEFITKIFCRENGTTCTP